MRRRDFLFTLFALASLGGCNLLPRNQAAVEDLFAELDKLLAELPPGQRSELELLAGELRSSTDQILQIHREFLDNFNSAAASLETGSGYLQQMYVDYADTRTLQRGEILAIQDSMYSAAPASFWPRVREVLNRQGSVVKSGRIGEV